MTDRDPVAELDTQFSSPDARPTSWAAAREELATAKTYWLSTVRPDGRPHVTTIAAVWLDDALHFATGPSERKAKNLASNTHVVVTAGCSEWEGLDIIVEGDAVPVTDPDRLRGLVDAYRMKYDDFFGFRLTDGALQNPASNDRPVAFEVRATKAFAFGKGASFSQTRWRFRTGDRSG